MDMGEASRRANAVVGIDAQSIQEVQASLYKFGIRYARRLFTNHEIECCLGDSISIASSYAGRFAAKEAVLKILTPREIIPSWKEIEVRELRRGRAKIGLHGIAAKLAHQNGIAGISVSISCGGGFAMAAAVATLEIRRS